jgi:hypothetical protein
LKAVLAISFGHFDGSLSRSSSELVSPLDSCDEGKVAIMENLAGGWTITNTDPVFVTKESLQNGPCISYAIFFLWIDFQRFHDKFDGPLDMS